MDLRSIINNEAADASAQRRAPVTPGPAQPSPTPPRREYSHPSPAPPGPQVSQEYGPPAGVPRQSPAAYPPGYQGRPSAPPIQTPNDLRSPAAQFPPQSPFRQPSASSASSGYPFPSQTPQSPAQPYPPALQHRESFPAHGHPSPIQHQRQYQQASPVPQTPPAATPGGSQFHPHRPLSSHSTPTPTSHGPPQYFHQALHESPTTAHAYPPGPSTQQRQTSKSTTPLGPPLSSRSRQSSGSHTQPQSPYQQRSSVPASAPPNPNSPQLHQSNQARMPSTPSRLPANESHNDIARRSAERERSVSVSPKTRVMSQPRIDDIKQEALNGPSAGKRKFEDQDEDAAPKKMRSTTSPRPQPPVKKPTRYGEPPIFARSAIGRPPKVPRRLPVRNGPPPDHPPPAPSPPAPRENGDSHSAVPPQEPSRPVPPDGSLGPWEPSIIGEKPNEEMTRILMDWLYHHIVQRPEATDWHHRGINVEIEAKMGQLIDKDTNERLRLPVQSHVVLNDTGRVSFRSSMTEAQHKLYNDFLNTETAEAHPGNPSRKRVRVDINYLHRREVDKFYELTAEQIGILPPIIRNHLHHRHAVKVRVTHNLNTGAILGAIIKARVADLDLYNPRSLFDCRVSINLEMQYTGDLGALKSIVGRQSPDRIKDRLSYTQSHYQIDLTQVTMAEEGRVPTKEHELEIELDAAAVIDHGRRAMSNMPNQYPDLVQGFINNVRVLSRYQPSPLGQQ